MTGSPQFNCGEYRPGQIPLDARYVNLSPPTPPIIVPGYPRPQFPVWPTKPKVPEDQPPGRRPNYAVVIPEPPPRFKCITTYEYCPDGSVRRRVRNCITCRATQAFPGAPWVFDPTCIFPTIALCQNSCTSQIVSDCFTPAGQPIGQVSNPITQPGAKYICNSYTYYCDDNVTVRLIRRICSTCYPTRTAPGEPWIYGPGCIHPTLIACQNSCTNQQGEPCVTVGSQQPVLVRVDPPITQGGSNPVIIGPEPPVNQGGGSNPIGVVIEPTNPNNPIIPPIRLYVDPPGTIEIQPGVTQYPQVTIPYESQLIQPSVYHPELNLFTFAPESTTTIVSNLGYPQIFNSMIASEVAYFINNENSISNWSEQIVQNLSLDKIAMSINAGLLNSFDSIAFPGGLLVGREAFLEVIRKHLLTGTLSEFQPDHYLQVANGQSSDPKVVVKPPTTQEQGEMAALGVVSKLARSAYTPVLQSMELLQTRRQRRLNEDVGAKLMVCPIEQEDGYLFSENAGICLLQESGIESSLVNGNGDGYYLNLESRSGNCMPMSFEGNMENTFFVPNEARSIALKLAGKESNIILRATSTSAHELTAGDTNQIEFAPIYLALDLSSVSGIPGSNPLIDRTTANYTVLTDQDLLNEHTDNNGFAVTRVNIDFRDPIYRYIKDTSSVTLEQNDITFRAFEDNTAILNKSSIARNIPFGLIVTPVKGSKLNPFNGFSKIEEFESTITRSITMVPDILGGANSFRSNQLEKINLYDEGVSRVGIKEPEDAQNITYRFYASSQNLTDSILDGTVYQSTVPEVSSYGMSYLVKDVVDYLVSAYDPTIMTWFDVYSRMPLNRFGELLYDNNPDLINELSNGFRNDVKITHVLRRMDANSAPVLEQDDRVVLQR